MQQCQGQLPRLKSDLPPQAWGVGFGGGRGMGGRGRGRGRGGRKRRGESEDESEPEPEPESDSEQGELHCDLLYSCHCTHLLSGIGPEWGRAVLMWRRCVSRMHSVFFGCWHQLHLLTFYPASVMLLLPLCYR